MTLPPAWLLSCYGIVFTVVFGAWKLTISPRLAARRSGATAS